MMLPGTLLRTTRYGCNVWEEPHGYSRHSDLNKGAVLLVLACSESPNQPGAHTCLVLAPGQLGWVDPQYFMEVT